jgi:hypothetical protein
MGTLPRGMKAVLRAMANPQSIEHFADVFFSDVRDMQLCGGRSAQTSMTKFV